MGDRANIKIQAVGRPDQYLYTHWTGSNLGNDLRKALKRGKELWDDPAYLARIIFCELVQDVEKELTGFGISTAIEDGGDRIWVVDTDHQTITSPDNMIQSMKDFVSA